jgi:hypothetical protein
MKIPRRRFLHVAAGAAALPAVLSSAGEHDADRLAGLSSMI